MYKDQWETCQNWFETFLHVSSRSELWSPGLMASALPIQLSHLPFLFLTIIFLIINFHNIGVICRMHCCEPIQGIIFHLKQKVYFPLVFSLITFLAIISHFLGDLGRYFDMFQNFPWLGFVLECN